jgi:hypothetical protein
MERISMVEDVGKIGEETGGKSQDERRFACGGGELKIRRGEKMGSGQSVWVGRWSCYVWCKP